MPLDVCNIKSEQWEGDSVLRWRLNIATMENMRALGKAFARAVLPPAKEVLRIGLVGATNVGKSTFVKGMLEETGDKTIKEEASGIRLQAIWHSASGIWIRHYDCYIEKPWALQSYRNNDLSFCGLPRIDLVEHPAKDEHDTEFDCIIFMLRVPPYSDAREVIITAALDMPGLEKLYTLADQFGDQIMQPTKDNVTAPVKRGFINEPLHG